MCSELFRIPINWGGAPIFGFGVLLLAWLGFSAWGLATTAKAAGWHAAFRAHLLTIVIVAAAIAVFIPRFFPDGVPLRGYGVMVLIGSISGIALSVYRAQQAGVAAEEILGLAVAMFIGGVVGARLFYVIEYWEERIRQADWLSTLKAAVAFTEGGLVIYGAFFGAMLGFIWYVRRRGLPALAIADMIVVGMMVGLAFGRIGCLLNGCCYGGESTAPWAITFPRESGPQTVSPTYANQAAAGRFYGFRVVESSDKNSPSLIDRVDPGSAAERAGLNAGDAISAINERTLGSVQGAQQMILDSFHNGRQLEIRTANGDVKTIEAIQPPPRSRPVHPAQIYSAITAALIAWVLWSFYPFRTRDGQVTALMITLEPVARFLLEMIRVDEPSVFGTGLSISQNISVVLFLGGLGMWVWLYTHPRPLAFSAAHADAA